MARRPPGSVAAGRRLPVTRAMWSSPTGLLVVALVVAAAAQAWLTPSAGARPPGAGGSLPAEALAPVRIPGRAADSRTRTGRAAELGGPTTADGTSDGGNLGPEPSNGGLDRWGLGLDSAAAGAGAPPGAAGGPVLLARQRADAGGSVVILLRARGAAAATSSTTARSRLMAAPA